MNKFEIVSIVIFFLSLCFLFIGYMEDKNKPIYIGMIGILLSIIMFLTS